jgi:hypothetical protein
MPARLGAVLCVALSVALGASAPDTKMPTAKAAIAIAKRLCATKPGDVPFPNVIRPWVAKRRGEHWIVRHYSLVKGRECNWEGATVPPEVVGPEPMCEICVSVH